MSEGGAGRDHDKPLGEMSSDEVDAALDRMLSTKVDERYAAVFGEIWRILTETYTPPGALLWLNSRNRNLGMAKPIDLVNSGRGLEARAAAYNLESQA